jgi:hypothetical protein
VYFLLLTAGLLAPAEAQFQRQGPYLAGTGLPGSSHPRYFVATAAEGSALDALLPANSAFVTGSPSFTAPKAPAPSLAAPNPFPEKLWKTSIVALTIANILDVESSWGKHELNPALASAPGDFGGHGAFIKMGIASGILGLEYVITRRHTYGRLYRGLAIINFFSAAMVGSTAAHNYTITHTQ